jgi:TetR/AcrR family transcriptional repressor of mexJK operon
MQSMLFDLAERMVGAVVRPEVVELRRMLIGEAARFPTLAAEYFARAPGAVLLVLEARFAAFARMGLLQVADPKVAAAQFGYLVVGAALDRAVLVGRLPAKARVLQHAREGVETFLARYHASR